MLTSTEMTDSLIFKAQSAGIYYKPGSTHTLQTLQKMASKTLHWSSLEKFDISLLFPRNFRVSFLRNNNSMYVDKYISCRHQHGFDVDDMST